jgi:hypothetical protein
MIINDIIIIKATNMPILTIIPVVPISLSAGTEIKKD